MATELDDIRTLALTVACPYRLPEASTPLGGRRRRREHESARFCGAQVGEVCRDPRTDRRLGKLPHGVRTEAAQAAREAAPQDAQDLAR